MSATTDPIVGTELLGLHVEAVVGRGGMGVVYRAYDLTLDRTVALKLIAPELAADTEFRDRFLAESRLAAAVEHPNVIPIHAAGEADGRLYLVMRYVEGRDLRAVLREGPLDAAQTIAVCDQVARALDAAHARGLVHRDVKPSNILLDADGHAYLVYFGLTRRLADGPADGLGHSLGTADYVAPEQIRGEPVDGRADVYSLGCVLYECLTGGPPFAAASEIRTLYAHLEDPPPAPEGVETVMERALAKSPDDRYTTCSDLVEDARRALLPRGGRRVWLPRALIGALVALAAAGVLSGVFDSGGHPSSAPPVKPIVTGVAHINPTTGRVTRVLRLPPRDAPAVDGLGVGHGSVWASTSIGLEQLDPSHGYIVADVPLTEGGGPMAIGFGHIYMTDLSEGDRVIHVIDPTYPSAVVGVFSVQPYRAAQDPFYIAAGRGSLWVWETGYPNCCDGRVFWRINPANHHVIGRWRNPSTASGSYFVNQGAVAVGREGVWRTRAGSLRRIDLRTNRVLAPVPHLTATAVAEGDGTVWALGRDGVVAEVDPATDSVEWQRRFGNTSFHDIVVGHGAVWIEDELRRRVLRIDTAAPHTSSWISVPYPQGVGAGLGSLPLGPMAVGPDGVWVAFPQSTYPGA